MTSLVLIARVHLDLNAVSWIFSCESRSPVDPSYPKPQEERRNTTKFLIPGIRPKYRSRTFTLPGSGLHHGGSNTSLSAEHLRTPFLLGMKKVSTKCKKTVGHQSVFYHSSIQ